MINKTIGVLKPYQLLTRHRPLRLRFDAPGIEGEDVLLPAKVIGTEAICGGFEVQLLCVAESASLALKTFIGAPCQLQIATDEGNLRRICGIVATAASGHDGGLSAYKLVLRDALAIMEQRVNTRVFRNKSELDIIEIVIREWQRNNQLLGSSLDLHIDAGLRLREPPRREFTMQHNESDAAFIRRLMQRRGIGWFFKPGLVPRGRHSDRGPERIGHTLVLFRDSSHLERNPAGTVRFHRDAATEQRDAITGWSGVRTLCPGSVTLHSWDYRQPAATTLATTVAMSQVKQGLSGNRIAAALDDYHAAPPHLGDTATDLAAIGDVRMAYHEYAAKCFHAEGGVRALAVGEWFALENHPEIDSHPAGEREFVVTSQRIVTENNLPVDVGMRVERLFERSGWSSDEFAGFAADPKQTTRYRTSFTCVRRSVRIVPPPPTLPRPQLQTAIVVGPQGEAVWCDHLGRVKVRFPAARQ